MRDEKISEVWNAVKGSGVTREWDEYFKQKSGVFSVKVPFSLPEGAFTPRQILIAGCMDERIPDNLDPQTFKLTEDFYLVRLAGSGIRNPGMLHALKEESMRLYGTKLYGISSHKSCGAAALEAAKSGQADIDQYTKDFTAKQAQQLGIVDVGQISSALFISKLPHLHHGIGTIFDGTGFVNRQVLGEPFTDMFTISRKAYGVYGGAATDELALSVSIAQGDSGFGLKNGEIGFSEENPFYLVVLGDRSNPNLSLENLMKEAESVAARFPAVKVVGLSS